MRQFIVFVLLSVSSLNARADVSVESAATNAVVAADGSGDFLKLQDAIDAAPQLSGEPRWVIRIKPGYYHAPIYVMREKRFITLRGDDPRDTIITYNLTAGKPGPDGRPIGTFRTPSVQIDADEFQVENLTLANSAGPNPDVQAVAVRVDGDRVIFRNCRFLGWQDTLLVNRGRQYFEDCFIAGHVDFIFGGATAFFERCRIHCWRDGYITAASTPADARYGLVFRDCRITGESGAVRTFLGRPWRDFASATFLNTEMSEVVRAEGWDNWGRPAREATTRYVEIGSTGAGASGAGRVGWAKTFSGDAREERGLTPALVLRGDDGWNPGARAERPAAGMAAIGRESPSIVPGFTLEGVMRYCAEKFAAAHPARVENENLPGQRRVENIVYRRPPGQAMQLDVYRLDDQQVRPAVLIIHGGGWLEGDRTMERPLARELAARGFVAVPVSYRLGEQGRFPAAVHDLKAAVRWLRAHAADYGIDPARIAVVGGSAGGNLAAFLGATNGTPDFDGMDGDLDQPSTVAAVVCIDGAVNFVDQRLIDSSETSPSRYWGYLGGSYSENRATWVAASPSNYVDRRTAPTLFINSTSPQPVLPGREDMMARLHTLGISSEMVTLPDTPHPFWLVHPWFDRTVEETARFLHQCLDR